MNAEQLHILQHSLGCDQYGKGTRYRNRFVTDPKSHDGIICEELVQRGLMVDHGPQALADGMHCYSVTRSGESEMIAASPKPPKLSRSAKRYRKWLKADCGMKFGEWLKQNMENYENECR